MTVWDKDALSAHHSAREMGQIEGGGFITIRDCCPAPDEADAPVSAGHDEGDLDCLVKDLRALHVWPQMVADMNAYSSLTQRQINGLYAVGSVAHAAADAISALRAHQSAPDLKASVDAIVASVNADAAAGRFDPRELAYLGSAAAPAEGEAKPVAWTGSGSLMALADGREGFIFPHSADAHPIPLYDRFVEKRHSEDDTVSPWREILRLRAGLWSIAHAAEIETKIDLMRAASDLLPTQFGNRHIYAHPPAAQPVAAEPVARQTFPILGSNGAKIDLQLVVDHGQQAQRNHYQSVKRLAERGGLSWAELHAVLHDTAFKKVDQNTAIAECRAIEARYLSALDTPAAQVTGGVEVIWHKTVDGLPQKPGKRDYEQIECLILLPDGCIEISAWNCEHLVWDDAEGDDFRYAAGHPTHWMALAPIRAALTGGEAQ